MLREFSVFQIGDKIIYGENGVYIVDKIDKLDISGSNKDSLYYYLSPMFGSGACFVPVNSPVFMRTIMDRNEAEQIISKIPDIEPAVCNDTRFNHVDAFYRELFKLHCSEVHIAIIKGLYLKINSKKAKSTRAEAIMKKAKNLFYGEMMAVLGYDSDYLDNLILGDIE